MANADVEIRLRLNNQASTGLKKAEQDAQKGAQKTATATERASAKAAAAAERGAAQQRTAYERMALARERLGIRPEREIQREILRTQATYNRLKASGTLSWREQSRAAEQTRQKVTQLTNEMGRMTRAQKAIGALKIGAGLAAGVGAAAYTIKDSAQRAIDYDYRLAQMTNTAFSERDKEGKKIGMKELETAINNAVKQGGGTRESAANALDKLIASGAVSSGEAMKMLPQIVKSATASGAETEDLVQIGIRAMQNFGVTAEELPNILNMALAGGQAGGFEIKDMARWLPRQMAAASRSGLSGRADFASIVALNQAAAITAGSEDEAGNNVANILNKINSDDTARRVKEEIRVDLPKYLAFMREKGVNSIDAFAGLINENVSRDPKYKKLQAQLANEKDDEKRKETLKSMSAIAQGSAIGKIVHDQQAMMALIAMINNQGYMQDVKRQVLANDASAGGAIDKNYDFLSETTAYKTRMAAELSEMGKKEALDSVTPGIGKAADIFNSLATEHTGLMGAITLTTTAVTAFGGAVGMATLAMGGIGGFSKVPGVVRAGVNALKKGAGVIQKGASTAGGAIRAGAGAAGGAISSGTGRILATRGLSLAGGMASAGAGTAAAGIAGAGLVGYGLGTYVVNPALDWGIQKITGDEHKTLGTLIYDWFNKEENEKIEQMLAPAQPQKQEVDVKSQIELGLAPGLVVQRQHTEVTGGSVQMSTGNIHTGAPS